MRSFITMVFVGCVLFAPGFATGQLNCPPAAPPPKNESTICAVRQEKDGPIFKLHVRGRIEYGISTLWADEATYNSDTGDVTLNGHVVLDSPANNEHVEASHGQYNVRTEIGRFYDVAGRIGSRQRPRAFVVTAPIPFEFSGKVVVKTGPDHYVVYHGTITNCELPRPKWQFRMRRANVTAGGNATIYLSTFKIESIPVLYFPFATHPVDHQVRQSGLLMPNLGTSSIKGQIFGEGLYWVINRSMDATVGAELFTKRGWAQHGEFRARPSENSYVDMTYFGVLDRGVGTPKVNQGGEDVRLTAENHFGHNIRAVANVDYLSSFLFRIAFNPIFTQPLLSEVKSQGFLSKTANGFSYNALIEHYQSFQSFAAGDVIKIVHAPSFEFSSVDRPLGHSSFYWAVDTAIEGLSRSEPSFHTAPVVSRFDVSPNVSLPMLFRGWSLRPEVGIRYTLYSQQLVPSNTLGTASSDPINRRAVDSSVEVRPPTLERFFNLPGHKLKHVIEPSVVYRDVAGVNGFPNFLRFDERDILSNTNEVEYRLVNRLYAKKSVPQKGNCQTIELPLLNPPGAPEAGSLPWEEEAETHVTPPGESEPRRENCLEASSSAREVVSWELAQKYFLDTTFGGALVNGQRNVFTTTVDLTAFAFLTSPRHLSPLVSRLRLRPTSNIDAEWDLDYDFNAGRINASTTSLTYRLGQFGFSGIGLYANFPGQILATHNVIGPSRFNQFRTQLQYGRSDKRGFSAAASFGVDAQSALVQYDVFQSTYNWDCCGITAEYRRIRLGTIRNENEYRFNYTLTNVGSFGNLLRRERLY